MKCIETTKKIRKEKCVMLALEIPSQVQHQRKKCTVILLRIY